MYRDIPVDIKEGAFLDAKALANNNVVYITQSDKFVFGQVIDIHTGKRMRRPSTGVIIRAFADESVDTRLRLTFYSTQQQ
ncbi:hypothetical protein MIDIC_70034 [Alphaproteobacteria bacterium]